MPTRSLVATAAAGVILSCASGVGGFRLGRAIETPSGGIVRETVSEKSLKALHLGSPVEAVVKTLGPPYSVELSPEFEGPPWRSARPDVLYFHYTARPPRTATYPSVVLTFEHDSLRSIRVERVVEGGFDKEFRFERRLDGDREVTTGTLDNGI